MTESTPLGGVDLVLADLDGVVYRGAQAIPHAVESINSAANSRRIGYITNNASRTPESVAEQLTGLGLHVVADDVVTSPQAAVRLLAEIVPAGSLVLAVGGEGLRVELANAGFAVTDSAEDRPAAVIQGFAQDIGWAQLAEAAYALQGEGADVPWVATNTDWTLPTARGTAPGNGTLVSAIHLAVGRLPVVAGKPEVAIFEEALQRFGGTKPLFIGDRLDTDILGANRAGIDSVLVLTGVDKAKQVLAADQYSRPTYILEDLRGLHEPYPDIRDETAADGSRVVTVGSAVVRMAGHVVSVVEDGDNRVDLLRAGTAAIWGSGLAIYGLDVAPALYE
ncbi:HAD superfamily hydrolase (TIGR01450 family) [Cryobacterium mesophilum]|uniref:HAD-IIA family hydrolase n=1 Tax=Terrimesophilobacter mesophilus TaxID=433647 RepID=A0A4R8V780_9MICO|nr:HAD-IIA family hydrolase [Terrimesophilobacter mesophilus]MBB5632108.1 HAD superfamily hydrolase (TIGR01450 family) [Terrimesophilobacter mesophilus]TFB78981.1 HAD-IIA family hydrolase [Terrimesophilobacter mesophilus]